MPLVACPAAGPEEELRHALALLEAPPSGRIPVVAGMLRRGDLEEAA